TTVGATLVATLNNTLTLTGIISDAPSITPSELVLTGGGSFQINGASTYLGGTVIGEAGTPTTVSMGHVNALGTGSITLFGGSTLNPYNGSLTLTSTRALDGVGTMAGDVVNNGGVLFPGYILSSYGTLQVGGNYSGAGTLGIAIRPSANPVIDVDYNRLDLGNHNFDASNTTLDLSPESGVYVKGAKYQFITTTGNVNGTFLNDQTLPNFGPYKPVISYNAAAGGGATLTIEMTRIYLTDALGGAVDAQSFPAAAYFDQQDNLSSDSALGRIVGALDDLEGKALDRALDSFVPEETDDATFLFLESTQSTHRVHSSRLDAQRAFRRGSTTSSTGFASTVSRGQTYNQKMLNSLTSKSPNNTDIRARNATHASMKSEMDEAMRNSVAETMGRGGYWTHAFGSMTRQNNSGDDVGFKAQTGGLLVGGDVKLSSNTFFGVSGGYTKTLMKMNENGGTHHLDSYMMSLYGTWFEGPFALDYSLTGSVNVYNLVRRVEIPGNPDSDVASMHNGYEISPFVGLSYELNADDLRITPFLNTSLSATKERGYRENGGLVDQQVRSRNAYFFTTEIGLTLAQDFVLEDKV
ncbi:MAG: autotransporter domain-containing protein, partial [Caedimonadaceae bacterium]